VFRDSPQDAVQYLDEWVCKWDRDLRKMY
jgi:hypothetical protein